MSKFFNKLRKIFYPGSPDKGHYSLSSDPSIKLKKLPAIIPEMYSFYQQEIYKNLFEVTDVNVKKKLVTITTISGKELTMSFEVFNHFFTEVYKFKEAHYESSKIKKT